MRPDEKYETDIDKTIEEIKNEPIDHEMIEKAGQRVWARISQELEPQAVGAIESCADFKALIPAYRENQLSEARTLLVKDHLHECIGCRKEFMKQSSKPEGKPVSAAPRFVFPKWAMAAMFLIVAGLGGWGLFNQFGPAPDGPAATIAAVDGDIYRVADGETTPIQPGDAFEAGDVIRVARGTNASVRLRDGSMVELRERSDFTIAETRRDVTIRLTRGSVIVEAAERASGHLYVSTRDCRVAVTGTVFSVNSGVKGSRVSVVEGEVRVAQGSRKAVLTPGEQYSSSPHMTNVPVAQEIAWSQNADQHIALMKELVVLSEEMESRVEMPGARYSPTLAQYLPADTALYAAAPNLGEAMADAYEVFRQRMAQSPALQEWWNSQAKGPEGEAKMQEIIDGVRQFSDYLGEEIVIAASMKAEGGVAEPVVLAQVKAGISEFIVGEMEQFGDEKFRIVGSAAEIPVASEDELIFYVNENLGVGVVSPNLESLRKIATSIESGGNGFAGTPLYNQIANAYQEGASFLVSADLEQLTAGESEAEILGNLKYMVIGQKQDEGAPATRALITFAGQRTGIASWLDTPTPIGALDFVSSEASIVSAFAVKEPVAVIDDLMTQVAGFSDDLAEAESQLGLSIREDLAAAFGDEFVVALDGPAFPVPSWKMVAEVRSGQQLQNSLQRLAETATQLAAQEGEEGVVLTQEDVNGRIYYSMTMAKAGPLAAIHYTFVDGYMVAAPSRGLIDQAIATRDARAGIATSERFTALLPKDGHNNFSAMVYHNVGPVAGPLMELLTPEQKQAVDGLDAMMEPTLVLAYAADDHIMAATRSEALGFTPGNLFGLKAPLSLSGLLNGKGPKPEQPEVQVQ